jgi:hypothetical protein
MKAKAKIKKVETIGEQISDILDIKLGDMIRISRGVFTKTKPVQCSGRACRATPHTPMMVIGFKKQNIAGEIRTWLNVLVTDAKTNRQVRGWISFNKVKQRLYRFAQMAALTIPEIQNESVQENV